MHAPTRWTRFGMLAALLAGTAALSVTGPVLSTARADSPSTPAGGEPPTLLAQFGGGQFGGGLQGGGGFPGGGLQGGGGNNFAQGGRQGGGFPGGGVFGLDTGGTIRLAAFCTELMADPPTGTTRFTGGDLTQVALADGPTLSLSEALNRKLLAIRGHDDSFDPARRDGSLALDLTLANLSGRPVRVSLAAGTTITPNRQAAQPLPEGAVKMFEVGARKGLTYTNTMQYAIWAARGSTLEEVEQTNMVHLLKEEVDRVQGLLDGGGIAKSFDRDRGQFAKRYEAVESKLGNDTKPVQGYTWLANGYRASVEGERNADGKGVVTVKPAKGGGEFYYAAEFKDRKDGRTEVKLIHLVTGRAAHANRGELLVYPNAT